MKEIKFIERQGKDDEELKQIAKYIEGNNEEGRSTIGVLSGNKEKHIGSFAEKVNEMMEKTGEIVFVSLGLASLLAIKDSKEIQLVKTSASISHSVMKTHLISEIEFAIDSDKKISHMDLANSIQKLFENPQKISEKLQPKYVDSCYTPIIESGGNYNLSPITRHKYFLFLYFIFIFYFYILFLYFIFIFIFYFYFYFYLLYFYFIFIIFILFTEKHYLIIKQLKQFRL